MFFFIPSSHMDATVGFFFEGMMTLSGFSSTSNAKNHHCVPAFASNIPQEQLLVQLY